MKANDMLKRFVHWLFWPLAQIWRLFEGIIKGLFAIGDASGFQKPRMILRAGMVGLAVLVTWASLSEIDQVVHSPGQVIASSRTQIVQSADGGVLSSLSVKEGDKVSQGQVVATLEKNRAVATYTEAFSKVVALRTNVARLRAEIAGTAFNVPDETSRNYPELVKVQTNLMAQRQEALNKQLSGLAENLKLAQNELDMNVPLQASGDVSAADVLRLRRNVNDIAIQSSGVRSKYIQDASAELVKAEEDLNSQEQVLADRKQLLEHTDLTAPANGIVKSVKVTTLGGVVRPGDELMQILPTESALVVESKVKPADMAFLYVGLPARVKLDAYDYAIFGVMTGEVSYISADTLTEETRQGEQIYYRVQITIGKNEFKGHPSTPIEVRPGMTATVDILSGKRSVLTYLTKPLTKTLTQSFSER